MRNFGQLVLYGLLTLSLPSICRAEAPVVSLDARAYWESAYISSVGSIGYTKPVFEQFVQLGADFGDYGRLIVTAWLLHALNDQSDGIHRRAFFLCEDTLVYGYDIHLSDDVRLTSECGLLWDFLGGFKRDPEFPIFWIANQHLHNPYLAPYWRAMGAMYNNNATRVILGVQRVFMCCGMLKVVPFAEVTWGDSARFESNYGEKPDGRFLGGSLMLTTFGVTVECPICDKWYVWGRYKQYFLLDRHARNIVAHSDSPTAKTAYPFFGVGLGCRF